ncbi:hypothetical protein SDC9_184858 [bioreactor metagenome]|uniref:Uncharacterized protein n=1 Tax=bioreactor metagenome TaxID=1076179 RepID=A0A645HE98_9ZZZZ
MQHVGMAITHHHGHAQTRHQPLQQDLVLRLAALFARSRGQCHCRLWRPGRDLTRSMEQALPAIERHKQLFGLRNALGPAEKQDALLVHAKVEGLQDLGLKGGIEVDQHIAA